MTYPAYRISPHVMEKLFTLEEIEAYQRDYGYIGNLEDEKKRFDEFIASRQGRA